MKYSRAFSSGLKYVTTLPALKAIVSLIARAGDEGGSPNTEYKNKQ